MFVLSVGCHSWDLLETLAQFGVTAPSAPISMGATGRISQYQPFLLSADGTCRAGACSFTVVPIFAPLLSRVSAESGCGHLPDVLMDVCSFILDHGSDTNQSQFSLPST